MWTFDLFLLFSSFIALDFPLLAQATTGCFPSLGTGIRWQDCMQVAAQRPHDHHGGSMVFTRCNGQRSYCDAFFDFSLPQGSAYGTCAFAFDLLNSESENADLRTATWDDLEREMADLVAGCIDRSGGQGGNHTWRGFVFVVTNPTQVDASHTCLSPMGPEEHMNIAQCISYRTQVEANAIANAPPEASMAAVDPDPDPGPGSSVQAHQAEVALNNLVVAGHKRGGAWVLWKSGDRPTGGYWTMLKGGVENLYPKGSQRRAYTYNGSGWSAWDGSRIPQSGAMIQVPENLLPMPQHVIVVWKADMWIPTLSSLEADPNVWWIWVAGRWTPLTLELLNVARWVTEHGAWRVMAGSWFFSAALRNDNAEGTSTGTSTMTSAKASTTTNSRPHFLDLETLQPTRAPPPTPPHSPNSSTGSKPGFRNEYMMLQGMGLFDALNVHESDLDARATKRPRTAFEYT